MIEIEHLTKRYGGHTAVSDLSFTVDSGQIYGFLGPNGAGKSTTNEHHDRLLVRYGRAVRIDGHDIFEEPEQAKRLIGYLPEQPPLYMNETPRSTCGSWRGQGPARDGTEAAIDESSGRPGSRMWPPPHLRLVQGYKAAGGHRPGPAGQSQGHRPG